MVHQERLALGEKCFVAATVSVLGVEAGLTIICNGVHFSWLGLVLGVFGFCLIMFLANRLYGGDRTGTASKVALGWIGFQMVYAVLALGLHGAAATSSGDGGDGGRTLLGVAQAIGAPLAWAVVVKALAYLALGWTLARAPEVQDFFADKRGELKAVEPVAPEPVAAPAVPEAPATPLDLSAEQAQHVAALAQYLRWSVPALIVLGVLRIIAGFGMAQGGWLLMLEGALIAVLGAALGLPAVDVKLLTDKNEQNTRRLLGAFGNFVKSFQVAAGAGAALALVVVIRIWTTIF